MNKLLRIVGMSVLWLMMSATAAQPSQLLDMSTLYAYRLQIIDASEGGAVASSAATAQVADVATSNNRAGIQNGDQAAVPVAASQGASVTQNMEGTGQQAKAVDATTTSAAVSQPAVVGQPYEDQLIDPDVLLEDDYAEYYKEYETSGLGVFHEVGYQASWARNANNGLDAGTVTNTEPGTSPTYFRHGLTYRASKLAGNLGTFSLNATAYQGADDEVFSAQDEADLEGESDDWALGQFSLRQTGFPLNEEILVDNAAGVHQPRFQLGGGRYNYSRSLVGRRFSGGNTEINGLTSRIYRKNTSIGLSYGERGKSKSGNPIVDSFDTDEEKGNLGRLQLSQAFDRYMLTGGLWSITGSDDPADDVSGGRVTLDSVHTDNWKSSLTIASAERKPSTDDQADDQVGDKQQDRGNSQALVAGVDYSKQRFRQSFGAYYYEPDMTWLGTRVGDDNAGAYYRFNHHKAGWNYGASIEQRRDGIEQKDKQKDTTFLNLNVGRRLNRSRYLSGSYSYRRTDSLGDDASRDQHSLSGGLNWGHRQGARSRLSGAVRWHQGNDTAANGDNDDETTRQLNYDYTYYSNDGSEWEAGLEYEQQRYADRSNEADSDKYRATLGWGKTLAGGQAVSLGLGYTDSRGERMDSDGLSASASLGWLLRPNLSLTSHIGFNTSTTSHTRSEDTSGQLVTDPDAGVDEETEQSRWQAGLNLKYTFGASRNQQVLSPRRGMLGSGTVKGVVYADKNHDGVRQSDEQGLAGVDVFLDSIHPIKTDENGEFVFRNVGSGRHWVFVDESSMPLPWALGEVAFHPFVVKLRKTVTVEVPTTDL